MRMDPAEYRAKHRNKARRYAKLHRNGYRVQKPALPYIRMVQALHAIGYTTAEIMAATGLHRPTLQQLAHPEYRNTTRVSPDTARRLERAYSTLSVQPCHNTTSAKRARNAARKNGWAPPMAWDDIFDPNDYPKGMAA